jgi:hypothetical protein
MQLTHRPKTMNQLQKLFSVNIYSFFLTKYDK